MRLSSPQPLDCGRDEESTEQQEDDVGGVGCSSLLDRADAEHRKECDGQQGRHPDVNRLCQPPGGHPYQHGQGRLGRMIKAGKIATSGDELVRQPQVDEQGAQGATDQADQSVVGGFHISTVRALLSFYWLDRN